MPEWLTDAFSTPTDTPAHLLALRLLGALLLGLVVAAVYAVSQRKPRAESLSLLATLVLLTVLIAMVTQVIGNSVARAFSLVGALSIVRFRTVVEDTRDTAFVIFAVVVGMAVGAGYLTVALLGIPIVAVAALGLSWWGNAAPAQPGEITVTLRLGIGHDSQAALAEVFQRHALHHRLTATATARQGAALDLSYALRLNDPAGLLTLVQDLNRVDGVQSVEARS